MVIHMAEKLLGHCADHPESWRDNSLRVVRSLVRRIGTDCINFPLCPGDEGVPSENISKDIILTKSIGIALYNRKDPDLNDMTIQITVASSEMMSSKLCGDAVGKKAKDIPYRQWKLNAIDGDATVITVRLDSTLNSEGKLLTPGAVIHVSSAFPVYMNSGDMYDMRCAIVLREFQLVGRLPVPITSGPPAKRLKVEALEEKKAVDEEVAIDEPTTTKSCIQCSCKLCSSHGISFSTCLSKCIPIEGISLARVAKECVFVTKELKDMNSSNKRFLLYYYYATSVYQFHGKGNRVELPECIVSRIRKAYPDEK